MMLRKVSYLEVSGVGNDIRSTKLHPKCTFQDQKISPTLRVTRNEIEVKQKPENKPTTTPCQPLPYTSFFFFCTMKEYM